MKSIFRNLVMAVGLTSLVTPMAYGMPKLEKRTAARPRAKEQRDESVRSMPRLDPAIASELREARIALLDRDGRGTRVFFDGEGDTMRYDPGILATLGAFERREDITFRREKGMDRQRELELVREAREGIDERRIATRI